MLASRPRHRANGFQSPSFVLGKSVKRGIMKATVLACLFCLVVLSAASAASPAAPYVGSWSNGRGDTLVITGGTIKFANDKAVGYRDITRVTNGQEFDLEVTAELPQ